MKYHIYAIRLDAVLERPRFASQEYLGAYYVGHTWHKPSCRFKQHKAGVEIPCSCRGRSRIAQAKKPGKFVKEHGTTLDFQILKTLGAPTVCNGDRKDALRAEAEAAKRLADAGYAAISDQTPQA